MPKTEQKKKREKLYHSEVKTEGKMAVQLASDVKEGQYGPYCFVRVYGEDEDRLFSLDSTKARREYERVRERVGDEQWVIMEAAGSKESATLFFADSDGNPILDDEPTQPDDAPFPPKGTSGPESDSAPESDTRADLYFNCLEAAAQAVERYREVHGYTPPREVLNVATTLYINAHG